eukprot:s10837_g2.t1
MNECIPEVVKAMRACIKETGVGKLFSANITADDPNEMIARGKYCLSQFGPLSENCAFLVDGYVAGGTAEIKGAFLTFQKDADQIYPGWKEKLGYTGESSVQAASFDWAKKASAAAFVGASVAPAKKESSVSRKALDQSSRYADLSLDEATLIKRLSCRLEWLMLVS